jgi:hypothetical protein
VESGVIEYSTVTGTVAIARRRIRPSRSRLLSTCDSIFCEMPSMVRRNWLKRVGCSRSSNRMRTAHLSPTRSRI